MVGSLSLAFSVVSVGVPYGKVDMVGEPESVGPLIAQPKIRLSKTPRVMLQMCNFFDVTVNAVPPPTEPVVAALIS